MNKEHMRLLKAAVFRHSIILGDPTRKAVKNQVNLHWSPSLGPNYNIGDYLSYFVVEYAKSINGITGNKAKKTKHLYAVGSILDFGYQNATVWGSGLIREKKNFRWRKIRKLDIRSVRGPETRRVLMENGYQCPEVYGDPAILTPLLYTPKNIEKTYEYKVIPHYSLPKAAENNLGPVVGDDWTVFIDQLLEAKLIISSSLHGIILAESYGIPAIMLKPGTLDLFKYRDYYYSTGRYEFPIADSVEEALKMQPAPLPDIRAMQKTILDCFPGDLWKQA